MFFTDLLQGQGRLPAGLVVTLAGGLVLGGIVWAVSYSVQRASGRFATQFYAPGGGSTAYTPTFSHIEALEVRGDLESAAVAWAEACAEHPVNAIVWVKSADFHLRLLKDPAAAFERYRYVRDLPGVKSDLARYVSQKIVDLLLGPLDDEGRALGELRRLIERFPGTREADEARAALARIKAARPPG
jgi:hypothetical protein